MNLMAVSLAAVGLTATIALPLILNRQVIGTLHVSFVRQPDNLVEILNLLQQLSPVLTTFLFVILRLIASYIDRLTAYVSVNISYIDVILKMIGIAYICRFSSDICKDAGCNAMASQVEMAGKITLILLSMPILMGVIDLVVTIVEG